MLLFVLQKLPFFGVIFFAWIDRDGERTERQVKRILAWFDLHFIPILSVGARRIIYVEIPNGLPQNLLDNESAKLQVLNLTQPNSDFKATQLRDSS
jgi:hypothetical protein